jgi:muramoyltetrapeptide carboxypeptidase LdcA involved in peptidoglycan recycling
VVRRVAWEVGVPTIEGVPAGHEDDNYALPFGSMVTVVAPRQPDEGPPRLVFEQGATT